MTDAPPVLAMRDVAFLIGAGRLLDRVNLSLRPGERLAVVGANGSGKSTLARLAIGLARPATGHVRLFGHDTAALDLDRLRRLRGRVGTVLQGGSLLGDLSVEDNLRLALGAQRAANLRHQQTRLDRSLLDFRLENIGERLVEDLSRGEQRRVELARALLRDPDLLVLDDPFDGVDEASTAELREHVERLIVRRSRAVLLLTQSRVFAERLAPRVLTLTRGRLFQQDGVEETA